VRQGRQIGGYLTEIEARLGRISDVTVSDRVWPIAAGQGQR
jgi:hypothetical protein